MPSPGSLGSIAGLCVNGKLKPLEKLKFNTEVQHFAISQPTVLNGVVTRDAKR